jgi:hypothetical protein
MAPADMHNNGAGGGLAASYAYPTTAGQQQQQGGNPAPGEGPLLLHGTAADAWEGMQPRDVALHWHH